VYQERLNEALEYLSEDEDLGGLNLSVGIVRDSNTLMDFDHRVDSGPASDFGIDRGFLRIDSDAIRDDKYVKEAVALLLRHEIHHARGADEMGAILGDLAYYRRLKQKRPGFEFPSWLRKDHPYFEFLEGHYQLDPENQVKAVWPFILSVAEERKARGLEDSEMIVTMTDEEAVDLSHRIQARTELREVLDRSGFYESIRREPVINLIEGAINKLLGQDIIEDNEALKERLGRAVRALSQSNVTVDGFMKEVQDVVKVTGELQGKEVDLKGSGGQNRAGAVAVALLMIANFFRGGRVSPSVLEGITKAYLEGKAYEGKALNQITLEDVIETYGEKELGKNASVEAFETLENAATLQDVVNYFNSVETLKSGNVTEALETLRTLEQRSDSEEARGLVKRAQARIITIQEDGNLAIGSTAVGTSSILRQQLRQFYEDAATQEGPITIDLIGAGYIHPGRLNKILETLLSNPERMAEGLEMDNFLAQDKEGVWGYNDGALVRVQLIDNVIQVQVQSLEERYEELSSRLQSQIIAKMKREPQVLVLSEKTLGVELEKVEEQVAVKAQSHQFQRFYDQLLEAKKTGVNLLKLAIPVVLPEGISREEVSEELILRAILGEEGYQALKKAGLEEEIYVVFYAPNHPAVLDRQLGEQVTRDAISAFEQRQVALNAKSFAFAVSQDEEALYGNLSQYLYWIVEGTLDAKKLLLIAEGLASEGNIKDEELLDFLKKADPEAIAEMNNHRLSTPKTMLEEFDLRIKTQRQTATMA
jgi:hypothetical protein